MVQGHCSQSNDVLEGICNLIPKQSEPKKAIVSVAEVPASPSDSEELQIDKLTKIPTVSSLVLFKHLASLKHSS